MIVECSAIILIILCMSFLMYRSSGKNGWSIGVLPLALVPAAHLAGVRFSTALGRLLPVDGVTAWIALELAALVLTCLMVGIISRQIKRRRPRMAYLVICGVFSTVLTCVLIVRSVLL